MIYIASLFKKFYTIPCAVILSQIHESIDITNNPGNSLFSSCCLCVSYNYRLDILSYSDNNEKLVLDSLSTTSISESDTKNTIHYTSKVRENGTITLNKAQARRKNRNEYHL
jgi:hypothetical protein